MAARSVAMKRRRRIDYTDSQKALMRARWRKGESLHQIARPACNALHRADDRKPDNLPETLAVI
ncbi:hypothetical protein [Burkholderia pyrrocinia]|uniref:hypothetical protein n=1 Tax=Burkholderia pyrrocinia TaxID=60550 RepID=UPI00158C33BC|nr:hypothetical protein [Burkholderia pyrrocinia]